MKTGKIIFWILAIAGVTALAAGCHGGFRHGNFSERVLERADDHAEDLNLDTEQKEKYRNLRARLETELDKQAVVHKEFKRILYNEMNRDNPNIGSVKAMLKERLDKAPETMSPYLDYLEEFYKILNEEQKKELLDHVRKKMRRCRG